MVLRQDGIYPSGPPAARPAPAGVPGSRSRFPPPEASTASGGARHGPGAIITELTRRPGARRWSNHRAPVRLAAAAPTHGGYRTSVWLPSQGPPSHPGLVPRLAHVPGVGTPGVSVPTGGLSDGRGGTPTLPGEWAPEAWGVDLQVLHEVVEEEKSETRKKKP